MAVLVAIAAIVVVEEASQGSARRIDDPRIAGFADWPALYKAMNGDTNFIVGMSHIPGLSQVSSSANGEMVVNFEEGTVEVTVRGLPPLAVGTVYEALLVDNRPGIGNSVALDWGPNGDDVINLGVLPVQSGEVSLKWAVGVARLRHFEVDMVTVVRRTSDGSVEYVIGGITSLFYKIGRRISLADEGVYSPPESQGGLLSRLWRRLTSGRTADRWGRRRAFLLEWWRREAQHFSGRPSAVTAGPVGPVTELTIVSPSTPPSLGRCPPPIRSSSSRPTRP